MTRAKSAAAGRGQSCKTGARRVVLGVTFGLLVACQSASPPLGVRPGGPVLSTGEITGDFIETRSEAQARFEGGAPSADSEPYTALHETGDVHVSSNVAMPSGEIVAVALAVFPLDRECLWGNVTGERTAQLQVAREEDALYGYYEPSIEVPVELSRAGAQTHLTLQVPTSAGPDVIERSFEWVIRLPSEACFN